MGGTVQIAGGSLVLLAACIWGWSKLPDPGVEAASPAPVQVQPASGEAPYSNVRKEDYVGPEVCGSCHDDRYQQWQGNLHRKMNQLVSEAGAVQGDFANARVAYAGGIATFDQRGDQYSMGFERDGKLYRRYRITRTIGSRYMQEYVGVQEVGPEPEGHEVYSTEIRLPFGFLLSRESWLHQQYFDSWHGAEFDAGGDIAHNPFDPVQTPWRGRCAWCHNTYAFENRLARLQGATQIGSGIELLYVDQASDSGIQENLLPIEDLVSVGISCESCHFGGREHAEEDRPIRFAPSGLGIEKNPQAPEVAGTRNDSRTINAICAQCHSTPTKLFPNGAGTRNSSEALDLLSGACASKIKCTDCHDPHVPGPGAMAVDQPKHLAACLRCHQNLADEELARMHSKHKPDVSCLDCHMPRMVQGVDELLRTHRISSPDDAEMLETSLNACNLCHLDRSVAWTQERLREDFGVQLAIDAGEEEPAVLRWLGSDVRILRLTAAAALGYSDFGTPYLPELLAMLDDPIAYDRLRYLWAIEDILGRELKKGEYDLTSDPETRQAQVDVLTREAAAVETTR